MANAFEQLKKARKSSLEELTTRLETIKEDTGSSQDDRFWKLSVDKAQNGHAIIRFLPAPKGESLPWVRLFSHAFQGPGGWYIENSLTTINKKDPVSEYNTKLWNSGVDSNKAIARKQKRKLQYIANIYVVSDPANPDNDGKVFLFKFGKKIFDKIEDVMNPEFPDETAINPFDLWEGADFRLRARMVDGYRNYDKSDFDSPSTVLDGDSELEEVWNSEHSLQELVAENQFKSYDDLKARFYRTIGEAGTSDFEEDVVDSAPERTPVAAPELDNDNNEEAEDNSLSYFKKLAEEV
jgi:hypothetical protein